MAGTSTVVEVSFGPFRLDASNARLLRDGKPVALTPKAFDVLHHLVSRPQRLVTKDELLSAVWPDVIVSDASVKVCVREIRKALDDGAKTPRYIETVHRRGYRFIGGSIATGHEGADGAAGEGGVVKPSLSTDATESPPPRAVAPAAVGPSRHALVGRDAELQQLRGGFERALAGHRQCVFITGDPGGGKTALVETFLR